MPWFLLWRTYNTRLLCLFRLHVWFIWLCVQYLVFIFKFLLASYSILYDVLPYSEIISLRMKESYIKGNRELLRAFVGFTTAFHFYSIDIHDGMKLIVGFISVTITLVTGLAYLYRSFLGLHTFYYLIYFVLSSFYAFMVYILMVLKSIRRSLSFRSIVSSWYVYNHFLLHSSHINRLVYK